MHFEQELRDGPFFIHKKRGVCTRKIFLKASTTSFFKEKSLCMGTDFETIMEKKQRASTTQKLCKKKNCRESQNKHFYSAIYVMPYLTHQK